MEKKQTHISTFSHNGQDIEFMLSRGKIAYIFEVGDKRYGNSVKIAGNTKKDIVDASIALIINYLETYAKARK